MSNLQIKKTDNSHLVEKVKLRLDCLDEIEKDEVKILECYSGTGVIWDEVKKHTKKDLKILKIEKRIFKDSVYLVGDNLKFIESIDINKFDIIDLDAYGSPVKLLEIILKKGYKGCVHCTYIQTMFGGLDKKMLNKLGYSDSMINKIPSLFNKNPLEKMLFYLNTYNVKCVKGYFLKNKNYFYFFS